MWTCSSAVVHLKNYMITLSLLLLHMPWLAVPCTQPSMFGLQAAYKLGQRGIWCHLIAVLQPSHWRTIRRGWMWGCACFCRQLGWGVLLFVNLQPSAKWTPVAVVKEGDGLDCCLELHGSCDPLSPVLWGKAGLMCCCLGSQHGCNSDATETIGANYFLWFCLTTTLIVLINSFSLSPLP